MPEKILVIDDDPLALRLISYALQQEGYQVVTAADGPTGLQKAREETPDLVVLDVMMPKMDGYEVCRRLRADPRTAYSPILMLTARAQPMDKVEGFEAGTDDYLTKPADPKELAARVNVLLSRSRRVRPEMRARMVGFVGAKGGEGTTTVAVNVAVALAQGGQSVILVDLHPYFGTVSFNLGLSATRSLVDLLQEKASTLSSEVVARYLLAHPSGLQVLASPGHHTSYPTLDPDLLQAVLDQLKGMAQHVFLDLSLYPLRANQAALKRCDYVVLVTEPQAVALECARAGLALLDGMGLRGEMVGIVVVNRTRAAVPIKLEEVQRRLGRNLLGAVPPAPEVCQDAEQQGRPLVFGQPEHIAAIALKDLAGRLGAERITPLRL